MCLNFSLVFETKQKLLQSAVLPPSKTETVELFIKTYPASSQLSSKYTLIMTRIASTLTAGHYKNTEAVAIKNHDIAGIQIEV
mmetsp:Transcript_18008/g.26535  ORF Transcript_18008/g.26535 Transcript_18008/m.26535 type:complete len:83 (+) Transcript_18008:371-619(+)